MNNNEINFLDISKKVEKLLRENNIEEASNTIKPAIAFLESINNIEDDTSYTFDDEIQFIGYIVCFKENNKNAKWLSEIYSRIYLQYAYILIEENEYDLAYTMLKNAIRYNPMSISAYYEMSTIYLKRGDLEKYLEYTLKAGSKCLTINGLAKYFRSLGYYYIEKKQYKLALYLYNISLIYEKNQVAYSEIDYIQKISQNDIQIPTNKECFEYAKDNRIDIMPNLKLLNKLYDFANNQKIDEDINLNLIKKIYSVVYSFTLDEEINKKIRSIDEKINNKKAKKEVGVDKIPNDVNDNIKSIDVVAQELIDKMNIDNILLQSTILEIIKLCINILLFRKEKENIIASDVEKVVNVLMMNTYKSFTLNYNNLSNEILDSVDKYYKMNDDVQTKAVELILYGFRKIRSDESIF